MFVTHNRRAADTDVVEDAKRVTLVDEADDSCTARPPDRVTDDYCTPDFTGPIIEVKWENFPDVKIELPVENDAEYQDSAAKVSTCCSSFYRAMHVHFAQRSCCDL